MKKWQAKPMGKALRCAVENMPTKSVRLNQETQGTVAGEGHRTMVKLPEGSEIALVGPVAGHPEMVEVRWDGESVWLFAIDFEARTKFESPTSDDIPPLARATSVGAGTPESNNAKAPTNTRHKTSLNPRVRRFNAAGRELL
jgi:hypothetical protein